MKLLLERKDHLFQFEASADGQSIPIMASPDMSAPDSKGLRPMQMLLSALAGCLSIDVLNILYKQRKKIEHFAVEVSAQRADAIPAVFTQIDLLFKIDGEVEGSQVQKAIDLGLERYCSVYHSLSPNIVVNCKYQLNNA